MDDITIPYYMMFVLLIGSAINGYWGLADIVVEERIRRSFSEKESERREVEEE